MNNFILKCRSAALYTFIYHLVFIKPLTWLIVFFRNKKMNTMGVHYIKLCFPVLSKDKQ